MSLPRFAFAAALCAWAGLAHAGPFSLKSPVIAIFNGELLVGEATAHLAGWGTIDVRSQAGLTCIGEFGSTEEFGHAGELRCSDGAAASFRFQRLGLRSGYGAGSSTGSALSFTYGLSAEQSAPYLELPAGKALNQDGHRLKLVSAVPLAPR